MLETSDNDQNGRTPTLSTYIDNACRHAGIPRSATGSGIISGPGFQERNGYVNLPHRYRLWNHSLAIASNIKQAMGAVCGNDTDAWRNKKGEENTCHIDIWLLLMASAVVDDTTRYPSRANSFDNDSGTHRHHANNRSFNNPRQSVRSTRECWLQRTAT